MSNINTTLLDYLVIVIYLMGIFFLAFKSGKKSTPVKGSSNQSDKDLIHEQYLAGQSLTVPESMFSIIATEVSALTFLGIPAFAYGNDFSFIQIYLGAIIGRIVIARIFLPKVYGKGLTIYSVMGKNGNLQGQRATAIFYFINKLLAVGVRLFSGSILVAEFFNVSIYFAVLVICIITFFYTLIGGLKAVVRTDMVQMGLFIFGGIVAHYMISHLSGDSWFELISNAHAAGKTSFLDFSNPWPFLTGVIGGVLFDMATHGVDQDFAQRLTANKSIKGAQTAIIWSSVLSIFVGLLFLSIGALLWSFYQTTAAPDISNDKLFAYFITNYFPSGVRGLMVAGVLAATMSTLDSTINALSACFYSDIAHHTTKDPSKINTYYTRDTLVITFMLMVVAFIASSSDGLLLLGLKITSWTAGSLLALFFATVIWPSFTKVKLDTISVIGTYIVGIAGVYLNSNILVWPWQWNVYFGFILGTVFLTLKGRLKDQANA